VKSHPNASLFSKRHRATFSFRTSARSRTCLSPRAGGCASGLVHGMGAGDAAVGRAAQRQAHCTASKKTETELSYVNENNLRSRRMAAGVGQAAQRQKQLQVRRMAWRRRAGEGAAGPPRASRPRVRVGAAALSLSPSLSLSIYVISIKCRSLSLSLSLSLYIYIYICNIRLYKSPPPASPLSISVYRVLWGRGWGMVQASTDGAMRRRRWSRRRRRRRRWWFAAAAAAAAAGSHLHLGHGEDPLPPPPPGGRF
jgi:hypothetical protein